MAYCVYKHTSPSGKFYIGITSLKPERRWRHGDGYKGCTYFYRAIIKYGWDSFKHEILVDGLTKEEACAKETELIRLLKANERSYGYNIEEGGAASSLSEETKEKIRQSRIGVKLSAETRAKMSISRTGKKLSDETKEKIGKAQRGEKHHLYGKRHSAEARAKMSASHKGEKAYWYGKKKPKDVVEKCVASHRKPVLCVETGEIFPSITAAAKAKNMSGKSSISNALSGRSQTAGKFHWKYYVDGKEEKGKW